MIQKKPVKGLVNHLRKAVVTEYKISGCIKQIKAIPKF